MNYNLVLWIGLAFYVAIFFTFIVYQMHDRKKDREQWLSDQLTPSFNKGKNVNRQFMVLSNNGCCPFGNTIFV